MPATDRSPAATPSPVTGCRRNKFLTLRWEHADLDPAEIHLADGKTGARTVHLSPSAVRVL